MLNHMSKRGRQQVLRFEPKRRKRPRGQKLGRRPRPERIGFVPHVGRAAHDARHPVHVSIKRVPHGPSFRAQRVHSAIVRELAVAAARGVRVLHYSIQHDHLHLIVEADDRPKLARGMQLLFSRIAFAVNRVAMRTGRVFRDRHHRHELSTPTEVRRALVYVICHAEVDLGTKVEGEHERFSCSVLADRAPLPFGRIFMGILGYILERIFMEGDLPTPVAPNGPPGEGS